MYPMERSFWQYKVYADICGVRWRGDVKWEWGHWKWRFFASFVHCLPNILHSWPHDSFQVIRLSKCQWPWAYFKVIGLFHIKFFKNGVWYGKRYYRLLIGNHTLAFDWCHFWWPWSTFVHFSLGCHFHVHFSNPWHAFASHGLPAIAELLVLKSNGPTFNRSVHVIIELYVT